MDKGKKIGNVIISLVVVAVLASWFLKDMEGIKKKSKVFPASSALYNQVDAQVGCASKFSNKKKKVVFDKEYKNHWMTWSGTITTVGNGRLSINIDGKGTQDLSVKLKNINDSYNLEQDQLVQIKFLMESAGGCFLPYGGREALLL